MARGTIITRTLKDGKTKRYYAAIWVERHNGQKKQLWRTFHKRWQAEEFIDTKSKEVRDGDYFDPIPIAFKDFAGEWIRKYPKLADPPLKDSTVKGYYLLIEQHLVPFFGSTIVHKIKAATIERDFKATLPERLKSRTRRNILFLLRGMLKTAVKWGYLKSDTFELRSGHGVTLPKVEKVQKGRGLNPDEIRKLLECCYDVAYPIAVTAVFTGMRLSELFALMWSDIDFKGNQIHVQRSVYWRRGEFFAGRKGFVFVRPKTKGSDRRIDIGPTVRKALLEHKVSSGHNPLGLVFATEKGEPVAGENFTRLRFQPAVAEAGIGKVRFHDLRHTFGSLKIHQGENLKYIQTQLGHSNIQMTLDTYGHLLEESNAAAAVKTDELVFGKATSC